MKKFLTLIVLTLTLSGCGQVKKVLKGEPGKPGVQGEAGAKGDKGEAGVEGSKGEAGSKGDKGEEGAQGQKGDAGPQGAAGQKGETGSKGDKGEVGTQGAPGPQGDRGDAGVQGPGGMDGSNGVDGANGTNGVNGVDGINGTNGTNGTNGVDGANGTNGASGADGEDGIDANVNSFTLTVDRALTPWEDNNKHQMVHSAVIMLPMMFTITAMTQNNNTTSWIDIKVHNKVLCYLGKNSTKEFYLNYIKTSTATQGCDSNSEKSSESLVSFRNIAKDQYFQVIPRSVKLSGIVFDLTIPIIEIKD